MAFSIDASSAFLLPSQLRCLAQAVRDAGQHDESRWIEWKATLPLGTGQARVHLVKHILGLANRAPDVAARWAGGFGYVVVGVSPGEVRGVASIDHNDLEQDLKPFLGPDLMWNAEYIELDGKDVLIVVVDPPKRGDPIHYLHKALPHPKGNGVVHAEHVVFVRRNARTVKAEAGDWRMLQERFAATQNRLDVEIITLQQQIDGYLRSVYSEAIAARLEESCEELINPRYGASQGDAPLMNISADLAARTRGDYVTDVDNYLRNLEDFLERRLLEEFVQRKSSGLSLVLVNRGDRPFRDVRFTVTLQASGKLHYPGLVDDDLLNASAPLRPHPYGASAQHHALNVLRACRERVEKLYLPDASAPLPQPRYGTSVQHLARHALRALHERTDEFLGSTGGGQKLDPKIDSPREQFGGLEVRECGNGLTLEFDPVDLRPRETQKLPHVPLLVGAEIGEGEFCDELTVAWSAAGLSANGQQCGLFKLPVAIPDSL
ncbi:RNA-binding domain-containing protein [Actinomadura citrea]|uniref:RNA-binding domain-containing protein n=1 Tax=Actinomadura citrea TaxID=46158 RepID=UPI003CE5BF42